MVMNAVPPELVLNMRVLAFNGLLHHCAYQASDAMVQQAERNRANQEQQKRKNEILEGALG